MRDELSHKVWRKSSRSTGSEGSCVEIAGGGRRVLVRDSKDPAGPVLSFSSAEWTDLTRTIKQG